MDKKEYIYIMWGKPQKKKTEYVDIGDAVIYPVWISFTDQDSRYVTWLKNTESPETKLLKWKKWFAGFILYKHYVMPLCEEQESEGRTLQSVDQVILDAKAEKEIPEEIWNISSIPSVLRKLGGAGMSSKIQIRPTTEFPEELHLEYACDMLEKALNGGKKKSAEEKITPVSLVVAIPTEEQIGLQRKVLDFIEEKTAEYSENVSDLIFVAADDAEKDRAEELLEDIYDDTGLAGSCYLVSQYRPFDLFSSKQTRFILDCIGLPMKCLYGITYYIDATGIRSHREIRKLETSGIACKTLRNYLDRAFLSKL